MTDHPRLGLHPPPIDMPHGAHALSASTALVDRVLAEDHAQLLQEPHDMVELALVQLGPLVASKPRLLGVKVNLQVEQQFLAILKDPHLLLV